MAEFPSGTVTFFFTDIEGSTRVWQEHPEAMKAALARHDEIVRDAIEGRGGCVVKTTGDGFHAAFAAAHDAIEAAVAGQLALGREPWGATGRLRVRMGIHTGPAELRDGDYYGTAVNRAARLMSVAHGGQIVMSGAVEQLSRDSLPAVVTLADLGEHRLRDLGQPEHVFQVLHPELPAEFPVLRSVEAFPSNLPQQLTTFVGRDQELVEIAEVLDEARVVTLIGVGGVGKTRLALQVAAELLPRFGAGGWLCELGPLSDASGVADLVAVTLSVQPRPGETVTESIVGVLRDREVLLVLDNCEHLVAPAARLVDAIVRSCPGVRVLATSREGLGVAGERLMVVRSLAVPEDDAGVDGLVECDAVRLFVDRAADARHGFRVTGENVSAIAQICRRLDGIPLAIELAAARTRMMSPTDIALRLDERFRFLTGGNRTAVERHQTLRAAVDWSYALLGPDEQVLLDRLGVFAGGFTLDAAEAVAGDIESGADVLDLLGQLVDKSLVVAEEDRGGASGYRLLETIRQYALEHLDATGVSDVVRRRHAEHYLTAARDAEAGLWTSTEDESLRTVDREMANLRAAFDWAVGAGDADIALGLAVALGGFGTPRPRYTIARWLAPAVDMRTAHGHPLRPHAAAWVAQGEYMISASLAAFADRVRLMDDAHEEAGIDLLPVAHLTHANLGWARGQPDQALEHHTVAVDLALASGDRRWAMLWSGLLAIWLANHGSMEDAIGRAEQSCGLAAEFGYRSLLGENALGLALSGTDPERAIRHLETGWELARDQGNEIQLMTSGISLAGLLTARGDLNGALDYYAVLLDNAIATRNPMLANVACDYLAIALTGTDYPDVAAVLFGALEEWHTAPAFGRDHYLDALETLRAGMEPEMLEQCTASGATMTIDQMLAFARAAVTRIATEVGSSH